MHIWDSAILNEIIILYMMDTVPEWIRKNLPSILKQNM